MYVSPTAFQGAWCQKKASGLISAPQGPRCCVPEHTQPAGDGAHLRDSRFYPSFLRFFCFFISSCQAARFPVRPGCPRVAAHRTTVSRAGSQVQDPESVITVHSARPSEAKFVFSAFRCSLEIIQSHLMNIFFSNNILFY